MLHRLLVLIIVSLGLTFPLSAEPIDYERLNERLQQLASKPDMVGLAVAVVENGDVTFAEGFGETHIDGLPVTPDTVFRWASLSKGVAGSVTGQLAEDGLLSFDDIISVYNTSLRLPGKGENRATLGDVLSHQLGIVPNAYDGRLEDGRDPKAIRRSLGALKSTCTLGDCHTYQNVAFDAISEVIESIASRPYAAQVQDRLFNRLGMTSASMTRAGLKASGNWARPYRKLRRDVRPKLQTVNDSYYNVPAAGSVNSSILDLAEYMRAQMGLRPDVLSEAVLDTIHTPRVRALRNQSGINRRYGGQMKKSSYGYGWRSYVYSGGHKVIGHRGAVRGYRAMILFDPERDTGVAVLWNSSSRKPVGIQYEVMDMVYGLPRKDWIGLDVATGGTNAPSAN